MNQSFQSKPKSSTPVHSGSAPKSPAPHEIGGGAGAYPPKSTSVDGAMSGDLVGHADVPGNVRRVK